MYKYRVSPKKIKISIPPKKVAGILLDVSITSNQIENMIIGVGINFKIKPAKLSSSIKKTPNFYGVTTLVKKNEKPLPLVQQFLYELEYVFRLLSLNNTKKIRNEWTKRSIEHNTLWAKKYSLF